MGVATHVATHKDKSQGHARALGQAMFCCWPVSSPGTLYCVIIKAGMPDRCFDVCGGFARVEATPLVASLAGARITPASSCALRFPGRSMMTHFPRLEAAWHK